MKELVRRLFEYQLTFSRSTRFLSSCFVSFDNEKSSSHAEHDIRGVSLCDNLGRQVGNRDWR